MSRELRCYGRPYTKDSRADILPKNELRYYENNFFL